MKEPCSSCGGGRHLIGRKVASRLRTLGLFKAPTICELCAEFRCGTLRKSLVWAHALKRRSYLTSSSPIPTFAPSERQKGRIQKRRNEARAEALEVFEKRLQKLRKKREKENSLL